MTTDLRSKTVAELVEHTRFAATELARRLEEAQQAYEASREHAKSLVDEILRVERMHAAHDARVAAQAKAEALEEAKALVLKRGEQIGGAIDPKRTAIELGLKAAEYRAKATEAGRKE